jgi:hypothetical protein
LDQAFQGGIFGSLLPLLEQAQGCADYFAAVLVTASAHLAFYELLEFGRKNNLERRRFHASKLKSGSVGLQAIAPGSRAANYELLRINTGTKPMKRYAYES